MPIYQYICQEHGAFESFLNYDESSKSCCPECNKECEKVIATNEFAAKTRYIPPPLASRKFGSPTPTAHRRPKWV